MPKHPNNTVALLESVGYSIDDLLPAYPGYDASGLNAILVDSSNALNRPVIRHGILSIHPCSTNHFNIHPAGFRKNSAAQQWPPDPQAFNIFMFGCSTTLGYNVSDSQTVASQLEQCLRAKRDNVVIYNFGSGSYTSRQEFLRFLGLLEDGFVPQAAIFLDGSNECYYAYGNEGIVSVFDKLYQAEKRRRRMSYPRAILDFILEHGRDRRKHEVSAQSYAPEKNFPQLCLQISDTSIKQAMARISSPLSASELSPFQRQTGERVWNRYMLSTALIQAAAQSYNVNTCFFWEPVSYFRTRTERFIVPKMLHLLRHMIFCFDAYNWMHALGKDLLKPPGFFDISGIGEEFEAIQYIDTCHFSIGFSKHIAAHMARHLESCNDFWQRVGN